MRRIAAVLLAVALAAAVAPEARRYAADRRLRRATAAFRLAVTRPGTVREPGRILDAVAAAAVSLAAALPEDPRPLILAGSAHLVARRPDEAIGFYRRALATGERAEIDLNLARAYALLGETANARAALLRAIWVSPALLAALPLADRTAVRREMKTAVHALRAGELVAPPPLPGDGGAG